MGFKAGHMLGQVLNDLFCVGEGLFMGDEGVVVPHGDDIVVKDAPVDGSRMLLCGDPRGTWIMLAHEALECGLGLSGWGFLGALGVFCGGTVDEQSHTVLAVIEPYLVGGALISEIRVGWKGRVVCDVGKRCKHPLENRCCGGRLHGAMDVRAEIGGGQMEVTILCVHFGGDGRCICSPHGRRGADLMEQGGVLLGNLGKNLRV